MQKSTPRQQRPIGSTSRIHHRKQQQRMKQLQQVSQYKQTLQRQNAKQISARLHNLSHRHLLEQQRQARTDTKAVQTKPRHAQPVITASTPHTVWWVWCLLAVAVFGFVIIGLAMR
ncbi:MAG: hypothetical protein VXW65_10490 [Pseudomonadota bacterium]|nr:hypothetical protein [Pseudomonadota bacterium]